MLKQLGLEPATRFGVVMATLKKVAGNAESQVLFRPWTEAEHSAHVQQVVYILVSLEQLSPDERAQAIAECAANCSGFTYTRPTRR